MKDDATPMVSCIMPTYNRRAFVPHAIQYFLRQDYQQKELILIDDGSDSIQDLVPDNSLIHYYRLDKKLSLGAKLNIGCDYASGGIIAHWDDDDWYASRRLTYQVNSLQKDHVYISGINRLLYFDLQKKNAFNYIYPPNQRTWLSGSSLCYKKSFWSDNRFADINVGMDGLFVWKTPAEHLCVLTDSTFAIHMIHPENGSSKNTSGSWWHSYPVDELKILMKEDWHIYSNGNIYITENKIKAKYKKQSSDVGIVKNKPAVSSLKNVFACLVHESEDCILDMVRNLQYHDPSSIILLYNGSENSDLLHKNFLAEKQSVFVHPNPHPIRHGYLHDFALECMQFAIDNFNFDTITIVDSDQLLIRSNYSEYINNLFSKRSDIGMLSCDPQRFGTRNNSNFVASEALKELELWKPLLQSFPDGLNKFVYWTFWPSTVFSAKAVLDLVKLFKENELLKKIMKQTKIWATEEVIFPTLISLLGYEIALNPCDYEYVKYRVSHTVKDVETAFNKPSVYWIHPVERVFENPLRKLIRQKSDNYKKETFTTNGTGQNELNGLHSILQKIEKIEGWLDEKEADLLMATTIKACIDFPLSLCIVEIGSYHGKSTVVFGSILKNYFVERKVYSIDSHDGKLGASDMGLQTFPPSFESFKKNINEAGISDFVEIIHDYSHNVKWQQSIALLFIDGLHDYLNVSQDFWHFADWVSKGAYIAFHDYADYYPGVMEFVNALLKTGNYRKIGLEKSLIVIQKV